MDLIDRQAAIDKKVLLENWAGQEYQAVIVEDIETLPSAQPEQRCEYWDNESGFCALNKPSAQTKQRWTPCSELLPKEKVEYYWVCTDSGWQGMCLWTNNVEELWRNSGEWGWSASTPPYETVVAWMLLPKPYKEVE